MIDGTYTLGAVVRERGGSVTYEATDLSGGQVEVSVYAAGCFVSPVALERSLRELRQLEKVQSPLIVRVIDTGKMSQGGIYEVHERLTGVPLSSAGSLPPAEVAQIVHDVAAALAAAQKVGVVHRNLGADSILREGSDIRLFNFAVGDPQGGVSFGAIDCIAPEQVEGKNIDERTLVYNLAALTYRLLAGQSLFTTEDTGTALLQHAASLPSRPRCRRRCSRAWRRIPRRGRRCPSSSAISATSSATSRATLASRTTL
ncbi:protein kinase domain-containing protein [Nannocystis pusilla]|uniref:protein kinase domain-containing protein n=1 Tax=Nannocystis pusilla TaxID=889268 RepID=UPI003B7B0991